MKPQNNSGSKRSAQVSGASAPVVQSAQGKFTARELFALVFGLFLGLAITKFGNPVILDEKIAPPVSLAEGWSEPWPTHWANWGLVLLALPGAWLAITSWRPWRGGRGLWLLPLAWFGWQLVCATRTVDAALTAATLWQLGGCVVCYFLGALALSHDHGLRWLLLGVLTASAFCMMRAVEQKLVEFPQDRQFLAEGQKAGWTNVPPEVFAQMKSENLIINTNGVDVANPLFVAKLARGRVYGTLVYPNALAGLVLLLMPVSVVLALSATRRFRPLTRQAVIALALFLGMAGFYWTGSKSGWLIAMGVGGVWLCRLKWPARWKWAAIAAVALIGLGVFAVRFHSYFAAGATSVGARFDYWRAAGQATMEQPVFGSGPGTFQRPYARLKASEAEMARLTHNDYLEQFSDSGFIGGICYAAWIGLLLAVLGRRVWEMRDVVPIAIFAGLLGWFAQGLSEFGLYIPALAWTAFCLAGWLLGWSSNRIDSRRAAG